MPRKLKPLAKLSPAYRKRVESYAKKYPGVSRKEARGHAKSKKAFREWLRLKTDMYRNVLGTGLSDKQKPFSLTLYGWTKNPMDVTDLFNFEKLFEQLQVKFLKKLYPKKRYNISDWWGGSIVRQEKNNPMDYNPDYIGSWSFEVNGSEEETGKLDI